MFTAEVYTQHRGSGASRADRTIAIALLISAGPLSAISGLGHSAALAVIANATRASVLATEVGDPSLGQRQLVVLQAANTLLPGSLGPLWRRESEDLDLRFEMLHVSGRAFEWTREDERTFSMRSLEDPFLSRAMESLYRTPGDSLELGQRWLSESCVVEAIALEPDGGLRAIRVRFDRSLDAPELRFLIEREGRLSVIAPPKIGESITVERPLVGTFGP
jgi:hypothetical protein